MSALLETTRLCAGYGPLEIIRNIGLGGEAGAGPFDLNESFVEVLSAEC